MRYTEIEKAFLEQALAVCKGSYQRELVRGNEAWSGATLRGKAKEYGKHYKASRANLLVRLAKHFDVSKERREHGRIVVVLTPRA